MSLAVDIESQVAALGTRKDVYQPSDVMGSTKGSSRRAEQCQIIPEDLLEIATQLFRDYSQVPEEEIASNTYQQWTKARSSILYHPRVNIADLCDLDVERASIYPEVVCRVQAGATFLDLNCRFGQDIRKLVSDGAPSENIIGVNNDGALVELGYEIFKDRSTLKAHFYAQSIFDDSFLSEWYDRVDIIYLGSFLQLFKMDKQELIMKKLNRLLRKRGGSIVFGHYPCVEQCGHVKGPSEWDNYYHSHDIVTTLFDGIAGVWEVSSQLTHDRSDQCENVPKRQRNEEQRRMTFVGERTSEKYYGGPMIDSVAGPHSWCGISAG